MIPIIAIDGPVSSGKGTVARRVASALGWHLLDSGALYRVLGLHARHQGVALDNKLELVDLAENLPVRFVERGGDTRVVLEETDVSEEIRQESVGELASSRFAMPCSHVSGRSPRRRDWWRTVVTWARWCFVTPR